MTRRLARLTALAALVLALLAVNVGSPSPAVADTSNRVFECIDGGPRPCVVSVLRNGEPLAELGDEWSFYAVVDTWTEVLARSRSPRSRVVTPCWSASPA